jgi:hypothetical protein
MRRVMLAVMLLGAVSAARAAGWWYLVVPPRSDYDERAPFLSGFRIMDDKPLSEWKMAAIFDSTIKCVARRDRLALIEHKDYFKDLGAYLKGQQERTEPELLRYERYTAELHNANYSAYSASRCVPAGDPGLARPR